MLQAAFNPQPTGGAVADFTLTHGNQRVVYKDETQTRLLVLNDRMFSINSLRPYEGWDSLAERMTDGLRALRDVMTVPTINEVSVRYINQIPVPRGQRTEDYFRYEIHTVRSGASYLRNFVHRVESLLPDRVTTAGTTFASAQPESEDMFTILLDIEFKRVLGEGVSVEDAFTEVLELKQLENAEFESVITNQTRELFS